MPKPKGRGVGVRGLCFTRGRFIHFIPYYTRRYLEYQ
jgi:hypothetical protein